MTRLHRLAAHPRRTLGALAVILAAVGITVGSGANFTASAANPGNAFSTGTLVIANSPSTALLSVTGMKPGDSPSSTVDITNTGSLAGDFVLKTANPTGYAALLSQLQVTVLDCGAWTTTAPDCVTGTTSKYSGTVTRPHQRGARQLRRRHQAPLQDHGHAADEHRRHLPGQDGRRRLRLVGHPVLVTGTHTREGSAVSGGRALPWVLHCAL